MYAYMARTPFQGSIFIDPGTKQEKRRAIDQFNPCA